MATQDDYIRTALRVPPGLHAQIHAAARASNRTFNAEIVDRLERTFSSQNSNQPGSSKDTDRRSSDEADARSSADEIADLVADRVAMTLERRGLISQDGAQRLPADAATYLELAYRSIVDGRGTGAEIKKPPVNKGPERSPNARKRLK